MVGVAPRRPPSRRSSEDSNEDQESTDRDMKKKRKIDELENTTKELEVETLESSSHVVQMAFKCNFCHREFTTPQALGGHQNADKMDRALMKQKRQIEVMHPHSVPYYHPYNNYYNVMSSNRSIYEPFKAAPFGAQVDHTAPNRSMYESFKSMPLLNWGTMPFPNRAYNLPRLRQGKQLIGGFNQTNMPLARAPLQASSNAPPQDNMDPQKLDLSLKL